MFTSLEAKPGQKSKFHLQIKNRMGKTEGTTKARKQVAVILDYSPSMTFSWAGTDRMSVAKQGLIDLIDGFDPEDQVAILLLDKSTRTLVGFTACDRNNKDRIEHMIRSVDSGDGTSYAPSLRAAFELFLKTSDSRTKKCIYLLTDGQSFDELGREITMYELLQPTVITPKAKEIIGLCDEVRKQGISIYAAAIGMNVQHRDLVMAISNNQFASCDSPAALLDFFHGVDAQVSLAGVSNARLVLAPVNFVTVNRFHGVTKGDETNYLKPDEKLTTVSLGDLAPDDEFGCYAQLQITLPADIDKDLRPPANKSAVRKAFGFVRIIGDIPAAGLKDHVIKEEPIVIKFALQQSEAPNEDVVTFVQVANSVYELAQGNVAGAAKAAAAAEQTQAFSRDRVAQAMKRKMDGMRGKSGDELKEAVQGATVAFDSKRIAAAKARQAAAKK